MIHRKPGAAPDAASSQRLDQAARAVSELRLSSNGLRGFWLVEGRTSVTLATRMLVRDEFVNLERIMAAMPEIFQAGVSMEMLGAREEEAPLDLSELILVCDDLVATAITEPRGRFGIAAILAPGANIALELNELRRALRTLESA